MTSSQDNWSVASAKAQLSKVIEQAQRRGPQTITRNGRETAIVVSVEDWLRRGARSGSLAEFFRTSPLVGSGIVIERQRDYPDDPSQ